MNILVADDHAVVRRGVMETVAEELKDVTFGEAANAGEIIELVAGRKWDLVLLDINLPGRSGIEVLADLKREHPDLPVLILSMSPESEYARRALKAGAAGYVSKQSAATELVGAIRKALAGGRYITPSLAEALAADLGRDGAAPHESLSDREYEVMKRIATGQSVKEIAAALSLSEKTVFTYRTRLLEKLDLAGDVEIARYALKHGLVE
jgi:two-component system, NarL family, invasion response regulator UvrY